MKKIMPLLCLTFLAAVSAGAQPINASRDMSDCDMQLAFSTQVDPACKGNGKTMAVEGSQKRKIGIGESRGLRIDKGPMQAPAGNAGGFVENKPRGIVFSSITFASGSTRLAAAAMPNIDKVGDYLARNPDIRLEIGGHTDAAGTDAANKALSQRRANAVMKRLISRGASESQFLPIGYGEERLISEEPCVSEKQRRVELFVVGTNPWTAPAGPPRFCD